MKKKVYYRYEFQLESAMNIGNGSNETTDKDILRNNRQIPYIPGSTMAGVFRSLFSEADAKKYFGDVEIARKIGDTGKAEDSKTITYDGTMTSKEFVISKRDCVGLDEYKTAIDGAKFDFEILEPGVKFVTYLEQDVEDGDSEVGKVIAGAWLQGRILFGSKTQRGYGKSTLKEIKRIEFQWDEEGIAKWLDFNLYEENNSQWAIVDAKTLAGQRVDSSELQIILNLKLESGISIRKYTTAVSNSDTSPEPDYEQLNYVVKNKNNEGNKSGGEAKTCPVIPGTTWAGAFLHQMKRLNSKGVAEAFGLSNGEEGEKNFTKSKIRFSESVINGSKPKIVVRNAIDRFTNATVDGALYTERTYYGGATELVITLKKDLDDVFKQTLAKAILDLHYGFLSIGGLTSVGRGIFSISGMSVNGKEIKFSDDAADAEGAAGKYKSICAAMEV